MLTNTSRWSHARGNEVVPSPWQATFGHQSDPLTVAVRSPIGSDHRLVTRSAVDKSRYQGEESGKGDVAVLVAKARAVCT
jgi:hypothetical protein